MRRGVARLMPAGSFARHVGVLTGGTVVAQGLAALALPLLTRLYSPDDFNLLAVYSAVIGIVTVVSCLRYNIAIPLPEDDADAMALLVVALGAGVAVSALLALPVLFAPEATAALLGQPALAPLLWMVPIGVLFASAYNALQYWASRKKRFLLVTRTRITRAVGGVGGQLGIGMAYPSPFGLLFGHMLYSGLGVVALARDLLRQDRAALAGLSAEHLLAQIRAFRRFPQWSVPESLFNAAGVQLPLILIAAAAAGPEAGYLMLAMQVMGLPMGLVGSSVAQVFAAEAPARLRDGTLGPFTRRMMWNLCRTGAPPLAVMGVLAPLLFPPLFGDEWARAGWIVAWLTPHFILQFVASPVSIVFLVAERQRLVFTIGAAGFALRIVAVQLALQIDPSFAAAAYAVSGALFNLINISLIAWVSTAADRREGLPG